MTTSISKNLTTFIKKNEKTLDIVLPILLGLIIIFMISYAFFNKNEYYSNDPESEKNNKFTGYIYLAIAFVVVVAISILYLIYTEFHDKLYTKGIKTSTVYGKSKSKSKSKTIN